MTTLLWKADKITNPCLPPWPGLVSGVTGAKVERPPFLLATLAIASFTGVLVWSEGKEKALEIT